MNRGEPAQLSASVEAGTSASEQVELQKLADSDQALDVAGLLAGRPDLAADKSLVLDLAYEEYCRVCEAGQEVDADDFCGRFPTFRSSLRRLLDVHHFLEENPQLLAADTQAPWPKAGQSFLGFSLERELGRGAFARVFLAAESALGGRTVVIKVSRLGAAEAQTLGRLNHPHIVPVHSVHEGPQDGFTIICMPFLGSATLNDLLDRVGAGATLPQSGRVILETIQAVTSAPGLRASSIGTYLDSVLRIGSQLADALAFAHSLGICHRDLKPSNILLADDGRPMLLDFNLSSDEKLADTRLGGTLPYMSPEQLAATDPAAAAGAVVDARSDLFSLGVVLHELLTGRHPFGPFPLAASTESVRRLLLERQQRGVRLLQASNPQVDAVSARLIERCLAFAPHERPASAAQLAAGLRKALSVQRRLGRWVRRRRLLVASVALICALLTILGGFAWSQRDPPSMRLRQQGIAAYQQGDYPRAVEDLTRSLAEDRGSTATLFARGRAFQRTGDFRLAVADFESAIELAEDGRSHACAGYCWCRLRNFKEAVIHLRRAVELGDDTAETWNNLGYCCHFLGKLDEAKKALDRAVTLGRELQAPYHNRARVSLQLALSKPGRDLHEAVADSQRALRFGPPAADLCRHAAAVYATAGDNKCALYCLGQAVEQGEDPQSLLQDDLFRDLRSHPTFRALLRVSPGSPPTKSVRVLEPVP